MLAHADVNESACAASCWRFVANVDKEIVEVDAGVSVHAQPSAIVGTSGTATVRMRAQTGDTGILGFPPLEGALFHDLTNPMDSVVRVEITYHGQVEDAGAELALWETNFWTGSACPPDTPNPNPEQPHCPVYFTPTHLP